MRRRTLVLLLFLLSLPVQAKDDNQQFAVFGVGERLCGDYLMARSDGGHHFDPYYNFLSGYLSAFNLIVPDTYNILGKRTVSESLAWLDRYCSDARSENFTNAVARMTEFYYDERQNFKLDNSAWSGR